MKDNRKTRSLRSARNLRQEVIVVKNFYQYTGPGGQTLHGYIRRYKSVRLRKKGFATKADADKDLRQAMNDIDDEERGIVRSKPTTAQEALAIYRRTLDVLARGDKGHHYANSVTAICKIAEQFVDQFGPNRLIRECDETDLREFYQILYFRPGIHKNTAGSLIGRIQGMLKAAQKKKPDLVNWVRPTLKVNRTTQFDRRVVEPWEYTTLVNTLLHPALVRSHQSQRNARWRDTADAVQLLRLTGGRLNEILRMKLDQCIWSKGNLRLYATKTESERDLPLWNPVRKVIQRRITEGLTDGEYVFTHAKTDCFDKAISDACRLAAKEAKLAYGRANGFTLHSLRHTFITHMMEATGNDVALVMSYSGHRSLEAFKIYLHPTPTGGILSEQAIDSVGLLLASFPEQAGIPNKRGNFPSLLNR